MPEVFTVMLLLAFLLGVVVGLVLWMVVLVFFLKADTARLGSALDAEQARESEALRRAQLDLVGRMGTR